MTEPCRRRTGPRAAAVALTVALTVALAGVALVAGACTSDRSDRTGAPAPTAAPTTVVASRAAYRDALAVALRRVPTFRLATTETDCLADHWVDAIGVAHLAERGVGPGTVAAHGDQVLVGLDADQARAMVAALPACGIDPAHFLAVEVLGGDDPAAVACYRRELDDAAIADLVAYSFAGEVLPLDDALQDRLAAARTACDPPPGAP